MEASTKPVTRMAAMFEASRLSRYRKHPVASVVRHPDGGFVPVKGIPDDDVSVSSVFVDDHLVWSDSIDLLQNYFGKLILDLKMLRQEVSKMKTPTATIVATPPLSSFMLPDPFATGSIL